MAYNPRDHFFKKAKKEGFLARSAYKLEEIHRKYRILRSGDHVIDLGCAPGAWSQVVLKVVGPKGCVEGIDLKPVSLNAPNARFFVRDVFELKPEELEFAPYDVMLSDMAPNTTGIMIRDQALSEELCLKVLALSDEYLKPGGHLVMKFFMGGGAKEVENQVRRRFSKLQMLRPEATRSSSKEIFLIGLTKKRGNP